MHIGLTFLQHEPADGRLKRLQNHPALGLVHKWWDLPLFHVRLPELRAFSAGGNGLVPGALASDADVAREEEAQDESDLRAERYDCRVCL